MTDIVETTVKKWRQNPFVWGDRDCLLSLGEYIFELTGYDLTAPYRGTYKDENGATKIIEDAGGEIRFVDDFGLVRGEDKPIRGDIVLADLGDPYFGLSTGQGIVFRMVRGVVEIERNYLTIIAFWKPTLCRQSEH